MDRWYILGVVVTAFFDSVYAPPGAPCEAPSLHVWPLGPTMQDLDCVTMTRGTMGSDLAIGSFQPVLGYNSTRLSGTPDSYITVRVDAYTPIDSLDDYAFQLYVKFDTVTQGTIFSFESDTQSFGAITKFRLEIFNGDLLLNVTAYGAKVVTTGLVAGTWYHIVLMRDKNQNFFTYHLDHSSSRIDATIHNDITDMATLFPATVIVGRDKDGINPLRGDVSCLQFVPCKNPYLNTYDSNCVPVVWPTTTTTTTTTTTMGVTTTTPVATHLAQNCSVGADVCKRYTLLAKDLVFATPADIILTVPGRSSVDCGRQCTIHTPCDAYSFDGVLCTLGLNGQTVFGQGSKFYTVT